MKNKLTERDLSRIVRRVVNEEKEDKKKMKDIPDDFFQTAFKKISDIVMLEKFSDIEDILGKTVSNYGSNIGIVLEAIYREAISRRRNKN
jgi:hypothetical protein